MAWRCSERDARRDLIVRTEWLLRCGGGVIRITGEAKRGRITTPMALRSGLTWGVECRRGTDEVDKVSC